MAWDAQGKWIPDDKAATQVDEAAPVNQQTQQLSGLMGTTATKSTTQAQTLQPGDPRTAGPMPAADQPTAAKPNVQVNGGPRTATSPGAPPLPGDASVENRLTGLLSSNSSYMKLARSAGQRNAAKRGLGNSSIAAGAAEAAAIAAAAPIASQDAAQAHQRNQSQLEGDLQLRNATTLQTQQDAAAAERLNSELGNRITLQDMGDASAMERLLKQGDLEKILQDMRNDNALTQTQINANVSLMSNYMQAFATLSQNPELPASARDAYMREFLRVTQSGQALVQALSGTQVTWPSTPAPNNNPQGNTPTRGGGGLLGGLLNRA